MSTFFISSTKRTCQRRAARQVTAGLPGGVLVHQDRAALAKQGVLAQSQGDHTDTIDCPALAEKLETPTTGTPAEPARVIGGATLSALPGSSQEQDLIRL
jgi:hypothetical protein